MKDTVYSLFESAVSEHGDEPAVLEHGRTLTYRALSALTDRIADSFPPRTESVGIVMTHRAELIASMLAVLKRGARYVPAEPDFPAERIRCMMEEARVDFILTENAFAGRLQGFPVRLIDSASCGTPPAPRQAVCQSPDRPAYVLYTSGTTGRPKGVSVTNRNVCHYVKAFASEFHPAPGDVMLQYSVCSFDIFVEEVFASLLNGAALAIASNEDKQDIRALMRYAQSCGVSIISGFPYLLAEMNRLPKIPSSVRLLISGGDVLRKAYVDRLLNQAEVYNTYGPSETTVCASYYRCNGGAALPDGTYPIGRAVSGAKIRILDGSGNELPAGQPGEICIYGNGVSNGYIGDHAEENRAFERQTDGTAMYRSGDLGYLLPSGDIAFLGRKDSQIMIYGKRVEIAEVESTLYRIEGVAQAVVKACADGDGLAYMIAYLVPSDKRVSEAAVREKLAEFLPSYMIPEFIVMMAQIPLNRNGKPDASQLPAVLKAGGMS